jgi:hypothetical protein
MPKKSEQPIAEQPEAPQPDAAAPEHAEAEASAEQPEVEAPAPEAAEAEQSIEDACAELGLAIANDGHCPVEILESISGGINLNRGDPHRFEAAEAVRAVRAGIAKPRA